MDAIEKAKRLRAMLEKIAPQQNIESIPRPPRAPDFSAGLLESAIDPGPTVESALEKMAANRVYELRPEELFHLEAIVMPQNRPVVFVRDQSYDNVDHPWESLNAPEVKARFAKLLPAIGRIELPYSPMIPYAGTGFVVGKGLLMTNRHVAQLFSQGLGLTIRYQPGASAVDFKRQVDTPDDDRSGYLAVNGVEMIHPYWDMALLKVSGPLVDNILPLSVTAPDDLSGRNIVAIGYPARDDRNDFALQDRIFGGKYYLKRLQPGTLRSRGTIRSFENMVNAITHDASTLGGNSGSAIIDVDSGTVVALHFAGEYLKANYAVPMFDLARDARVAPKLNFQGSLTPTNDWEPSWRSVSGAESSQPQGQPVVTPSSAAGKGAGPTLQSPAGCDGLSAGETATWTIPIHVSVSIGQPMERTPVAPAASPAESEFVEEGVVVDQDYSTRPGYDPDFLEGLAVPLPAISDKMKDDTAQVPAEARTHGDPFELAYYHYSVYMNKLRRTAWFSAANVDGDQRPAIGKRQGDRWYRDTRILKSEQLGQEAFEPGIDRGHLTRREDTAWGSDVEQATAANNDTFHFTNCSLQASAFNRGKDRWQGLEQFLLEQHAKKEKRRMTVITGPLFTANDPVYKNDRMNYSVRCPLQFWKVCVLIRQDGSPSATAFVLGQEEIKDLPGFEEAFDVAATQIKITELAKRTRLDFGDLWKHDHFAQGGDPGTIEGIQGTTDATKEGRIIRNPDDIIV
jgi:endonuclease G, mitochondrial